MPLVICDRYLETVFSLLLEKVVLSHTISLLSYIGILLVSIGSIIATLGEL